MQSFPEFTDRRDAGRRLAGAMAHLKGSNAIVLALPRGGVPVGFEVARALDANLDVLIVRKIGAPGHEELGIGAIVGGPRPELVLNEDVAQMVGASSRYVEMEKARQLTEIERRKLVYRGDRPSPSVAGRTVIVVDDGIATGSTMKAALKALRRMEPARLVLAVPVAPPDSIAALASECDEVVCLSQPWPFFAVGAHYADFRQTEDSEVVRLLAEARRPSQMSAT